MSLRRAMTCVAWPDDGDPVAFLPALATLDRCGWFWLDDISGDE